MSSFLPCLRTILSGTQLRQHQKSPNLFTLLHVAFQKKNYNNSFILLDSLHRFSKVCSVVFKCLSDYRALALEVWIKKKKKMDATIFFLICRLR